MIPLCSCDTSIFIQAWRRHYRPKTFPVVWRKIEELIDAGVLIACDEVLTELHRKDDDVYDWAKKWRKMFVPIDELLQRETKTILAAHRRLVDSKKGRSGTDPWVIGLAKLRGAAVLTEEKPSNKIEVPRIPDVCHVLGIECHTLADFFEKNGIRFS